MSPELPDELLLMIGEQLHCQPSLAALCRVSKHFNRLFKRILYREIDVRRCSLDDVTRIYESPLVRYMRHLGPYSFRRGDTIEENVALLEAIISAMPKMKSLRSFSTGGQFLCLLCHDTMNNPISFVQFLQLLAELETIRDLDLNAPYLRAKDVIPQFHNLERLSVDLDRKLLGYEKIDDYLSEMLLSSPELTHLKLYSTGDDQYHIPNGLMCLIKTYEQKRQQRSLPVLKLTNLELGEGYVPYRGLHISYGYGPDYLSKLTDLTNLRSLRLYNELYYREEENEATWSGINPQVFANVTQLHHLAVSEYTGDIGELVMLPNLKNTLSEIQISQYYTQKWNGEDNDPISYFRKAGPPLKKLILGCPAGSSPGEAINVIEKVILKTPQIEQFATSVTMQSYALIKDLVLPSLQNLTAFFITSNLGALSTSGRRHHQRKMLQQKENARRAMEIFHINRSLVSENENFQALRYVGIYKQIFTCRPLNPHFESKDSEDVFAVETRDTNGKSELAYHKVTELSQCEKQDFSDIISMIDLP
ncbi:hypothetical protein MW887_008242 [Aspergillus wentii]|nr:hypothetical protein MW887_008242 [Aspergillus wentii]